jgi:hypothetical protein
VVLSPRWWLCRRFKTYRMCGLLCAESLTFARWLNEPCRRNIAIITRARVADSGVCVCVCMYASDRGANVRSWGVSACVPELACLAEFVWVCVWLRLGLLFGCIGGVSLLRACVQFRFASTCVTGFQKYKRNSHRGRYCVSWRRWEWWCSTDSWWYRGRFAGCFRAQ